MSFSYSAKDVTTVVLVGAMLFVLLTRLKKGADADWPLVFWAALFAFNTSFDGPWPPNALFFGIGVALFYKFEFLGGTILGAVKWLDIAVLLYLAYVGFAAAFNLG